MSVIKERSINMNKIAIIDPASYALPYDYFFIRSLSKDYEIDFFVRKQNIILIMLRRFH